MEKNKKSGLIFSLYLGLIFFEAIFCFLLIRKYSDLKNELSLITESRISYIKFLNRIESYLKKKILI